MRRAVLRYLQKAPQVARYMATDPVEVWRNSSSDGKVISRLRVTK
jgi:hypothetical protein